MFRDHELEDGVAEKLEPLIVELLFLFFVPQARMGQGLDQKLRVLKLVTDSFFERVHAVIVRAGG